MIMKTKKKIKKRNQRILLITVLVIIITLMIFNLNDLLDGFRDGIKASQGSY